MKKFNLDAALNGEPINASGQKCYIVREVTNFFDDQSIRRFVVIFDESFTDAEIWDEHDLIDNVEMWEEPKISIEDLPKPFKPKTGDEYKYIIGTEVFRRISVGDSFDRSLSMGGQCYRTEEDAQKWVDFMKSMME